MLITDEVAQASFGEVAELGGCQAQELTYPCPGSPLDD